MAYQSTGMAAMFPVYLARMAQQSQDREAYDIAVAQNEVNLNQNLTAICHKLLEIEAFLESEQA